MKGGGAVSGTLYLVGTPIGNLQDLTPRAAATLGLVDFVAAEDTRVTLKLLNHLGLKKPLVSYHEHALARGAGILARVQAGESCAVCTDAGMPCISDPGEPLVREALAMGLPVVPVPGPSAFVTALAVSGQSTARFVFEGFLPAPKKERRARLAALAGEERTVILYEAPHRLRATLAELAEALGPDRPLTLCRELTKVHEEIFPTTLAGALARCEQAEPRGEYVLVLAGAPPAETAPVTLDEAVAAARALLTQGLPPAEAAKQAAAGTPWHKKEIYRALTARDEGETEA